MFARNINFDTTSMKRRQQISFVLNAVVTVICIVLLVYSYKHIDIVPKTVRHTVLALSFYEWICFAVGLSRFVKQTPVEEVTVTNENITINGDTYPLGEEGEHKVVIDPPLARDLLNLIGRSISIRDSKNNPVKVYWMGPSRHSHSEERRREFIEAVKEARENKETEDIGREISGNDDKVRIEFPVKTMRNQLMISSILLMIMGVLLWGVGKFTLGNDSFIYSVGSTFGALTAIYGMFYGLYSMYNMSRAVKVVEISPKGITVNDDFYDAGTKPEISFNSSLNMNDNEQGVDISIYMAVKAGGIKRKYWAGPKNEKKTAEARRKLMAALDKFLPGTVKE